MKKLLAMSIALTMCWCMGCAPRDHLSRDDIPPWDSGIPSDYVPEVRSAIDVEKIPEFLDEDQSGYDFRKTRWGFTPERVKLSEVAAGRRPDEDTREQLVYTLKINDVKCKLVYTFKDNKLRTAGFITKQPIKNAENLIQTVLDRHGMPEDTEKGMVWKGADSVIYTDSYASVIKETQTRYKYTDGGLLSNILSQELQNREKAGEIVHFDGVIGYVDREFYDALYKMRYRPTELLLELSLYEKQLMGIIERRGQTIIPGVGRIPN